jgi:membrane protease YdiL (CAAX protease family)
MTMPYGGPPGSPAGPPSGLPGLPTAADPVAAHPHAQPTVYPLILRTWAYAWWRPALGIVLLLAGALLVAPLVLMPVLAVGVAVQVQLQGGDFSRDFTDALDQSTLTPASLLYLNLALAGLVLITWALVRWLHRLRPRWLMSVRPGVRWRFLWACAGIAVIAILAQVLLGLALPETAGDATGDVAPFTGETLAFLLVILVSTPLQAMGEEYGFRGYAMQAFGALTDSVSRAHGASPRRAEQWAVGIAIGLSSVLFALAHGVQNFPLFFDRFAFGVLAGYLVYRVGGLEAGIALHVLNNLVAYGFALTYGQMSDALTITEVSWWNIPLTVTQNGVYLVLVVLLARRMGIDNRTRPPVLVDESRAV